MKEEHLSEAQIKRRTLISFAVFLTFVLAAIFLWIGLRRTPKEQGVQPLLRKGYLVNEQIFSGSFPEGKLVPTYAKGTAVKKVRVNGSLGLRSEVDTAAWRMSVVRRSGDTLHLTLEDLQRLPKTEVVFDFKCIEGWSQRTWWGGVKVADFIQHYGLEPDVAFNYAGIATPDKQYYVGIDMPSFLHPQTLLCYEMNGAPLPLNQGYPLRLIIPVKYGIKHIKRIGTVSFSNQRPPDYWAERGYDYHSGH